MQNATIYDLGEMDTPLTERSTSTDASRADRRAPAGRASSWYRGDSGTGVARRVRAQGTHLAWVPASLSLLIPGTGQLVAGSHAAGLFFLSAAGFVTAFAWAITDSIDRLARTLPWIGLAPQVALWGLAGTFLAAAGLHVASVLHASSLVSDEPCPPHPVAAALASLLIPGWGQILNGARLRAGFFLAGLWVMGAAAWLMLPAGDRLLAAVGLVSPFGGSPAWLGLALLAVPGIMWTLAVYDAATCAAGRRR